MQEQFKNYIQYGTMPEHKALEQYNRNKPVDAQSKALDELISAVSNHDLKSSGKMADKAKERLEKAINGCSSNNVEINAQHPATGKTALHEAIKAGSAVAAEKLIAKGADPKVADYRGNTSMHVLAQEVGKLDAQKDYPAEIKRIGHAIASHGIIESTNDAGLSVESAIDEVENKRHKVQQGAEWDAMWVKDAPSPAAKADQATNITSKVDDLARRYSGQEQLDPAPAQAPKGKALPPKIKTEAAAIAQAGKEENLRSPLTPRNSHGQLPPPITAAKPTARGV